MKASPKIILSGGGTGGHIYPALALADTFKADNPSVDILFVGAQNKMEMQKIPEQGYRIVGLPITGIQRKISFKNLLFPIKLSQSIYQALRLVDNYKPDIIIGTGGFASGPILMAGLLRKVPCFIQEQNAYAGITNKYLARWMQSVFVAHPNMEKHFPKEKIVYTGNPLRLKENLTEEDAKQAKLSLGLDPDKKTILSLGGSLGAQSINDFWRLNAQKLVKENPVQLLWQTGTLDYEMALKSAENKGVFVYKFIENINSAYCAADIIVSRAGAMSISELCLVGKPCIFVPYPFATGDHQTKNAHSLVKQNAALMVQNAKLESLLYPILEDLLNHPKKQQCLSENIKKQAKPKAAEKIVEKINMKIFK